MKLKWYGIIGIIAAFIGCIGDVLLLYSPNGGYENMDYLFFNDIADWRICLGHYLGVLFIPLELVGFWQVYQALKESNSRLVIPVLMATVYVMVIGVAYHGMVGMGGLLVHAQQVEEIGVVSSYLKWGITMFEPLGSILFFVFLFISFGLFYLIYSQKTAYPRWVAFTNPLFTYLIWVLLYLISPAVGGLFVVAGFNLSILIFLAVSTIVLWD